MLILTAVEIAVIYLVEDDVKDNYDLWLFLIELVGEFV